MRVITKLEPIAPPIPRLKRVAAYARVSSGKDAMLHSLSAQVSYYSDYIQRHGEWEYVGVYADEAFTGTKEDRPEFQRLINDCRDGKIDMVITKSIARFARNTVTLLEIVRELKLLGIGIYFEKDYIKKRPYTTYGRFSCNIILYIVLSHGILALDIVPCRLLVA